MPKILIIEDEISIQRIIEYDLKQLDYEVTSALDGLEGYNKAINNYNKALKEEREQAHPSGRRQTLHCSMLQRGIGKWFHI